MHTGTVPIQWLIERTQDWFAAPFDVDAVALGEPGKQIAGDPHLVSGALRTFTEDLELPLALRHFGVDTFKVDPGVEGDVDVLCGAG